MDELDAPVEETVMLTRRMRRTQVDAAVTPAVEADADASPVDASPADAVAADALPSDADDAVDESTILVSERTVVITRDRGALPPVDEAERTVVITRDRGALPPVEEAERTVIVPRDRPESATPTAAASATPAAAITVPPRQSTREQTPTIYKARPAPLTPQPPPAVIRSVAVTRVPPPPGASLAARSRRAGLYAIITVVAACVVSVAGLTALGFLVFG